MQLMDQDLSALITRGLQEGFLTYEEVNAYLPDEDVNPEKLDRLLLALEHHGIKLVDSPIGNAQRARSPEPNLPEMRGTCPDLADADDAETPRIVSRDTSQWCGSDAVASQR